MNYRQVTSEADKDIPYLHSIYMSPEISRYISIDEVHYWHYVTATENVFYYKIYQGDCLVAAVHCELSDKTLYMDLVVIPKYQKKGIGTMIIRDIITGKLQPDFERIEVSIDESNIPSIRLFEKMQFRYVSKEDELLNYVYQKEE